MDKGLERRLSTYEPLWDEWYVDSFSGEDSSGAVFRLKDRNGRKSAVRVLTVREDGGAALAQKTAAAVSRINSLLPLAGEAFIVSVRNFTVKNHENIGGAPVAADILVQTDEYEPLSSLTAQGQLPYVTARKLADNICRGLRSAHAAGFAFGDICPNNIRIDSEGHFCLDLPCVPDAAASAPYAAPETAAGDFDKFKADIYSFGIVLYQLFNGGLLPLCHAGEASDIAVSARMNGAAFDPPRGAPPELGRMIMQCCMAHPESRYESMDEVWRVLSQLTVDRVPREYEECYVCDMCEKRVPPAPEEQLPEEPPHEPVSEQVLFKEEPKESRGMRLYVMVLLYMLLAAGIGFLLYSVFFLK